MKNNLFKHFIQLFRKHNSQPLIMPERGSNPTKKGFGLTTKMLKKRRKALRLRQKYARMVNRGSHHVS